MFGRHQLRVLSASQVNQFECPRKWCLSAIEGIKEPQRAEQRRGIDTHYEMEVYCQQGTTPQDRLAVALLPYAPTPGHSAVEVPVRFDLPSGPFLGFIDAAYDWELNGEPVYATTGRQRIPRLRVSGRSAELATTGITVLCDWKTVKSIKYVKRAEELLADVASNTYAWEAFQGGARRVFGRWVYVDEGLQTAEVWFEFQLADVLERIISIDAVADVMQHHWVAKTPAAEMECNTSVCHRYRKRDPKPGEPTGSCWYLEAGHCSPISTFKMPTGESK